LYARRIETQRLDCQHRSASQYPAPRAHWPARTSPAASRLHMPAPASAPGPRTSEWGARCRGKRVGGRGGYNNSDRFVAAAGDAAGRTGLGQRTFHVAKRGTGHLHRLQPRRRREALTGFFPTASGSTRHQIEAHYSLDAQNPTCGRLSAPPHRRIATTAADLTSRLTGACRSTNIASSCVNPGASRSY
jgi:hypothetical protein